MSLNRYYKRIVLIPPAFVLAGFVAFAIYERATYKSEWLTADSFEPLEFAMIVIHCLIVSCLCLPVLLNRRSEVSESTTGSFLSWFGLPMIYFGVIWSQVKEYSGMEDGLLALSSTLPYVVMLSITFIQFRRSRKAPSPPASE